MCIATFRRNGLLSKLLDSLRMSEPVPPRLIVVDNDPAAGAADTVRSTYPEAIYLHEPRPGIAEARNAALDALPDDTTAVVFVDDDERVFPGWLSTLAQCADKFNADVVTGPVISLLPDTAPDWIIRGSFIQREDYATGPYRYLPATNNTFVRAHWFVGSNPYRFDETFSLTGGSDTELFNRMRIAGAKMFWCQEAAVEESVPLDRLTAKWIWKRGVRSGNVLARLQLQSRSRARVIGGGAVRFVYGLFRVAVNALRFRPLQYSDAIYVMRGVGFVNAALGRLHVEYARKQQVVQ